jgi:hypothetical protein
MADAKQVVERHIDAFNAHQADADPWAEDAEFVAPGASMRGREDVLGFLGAFWEAFPDGRLEHSRVFGEGSVVAAEGRFIGTHSGVFRTPTREVPRALKATDRRRSAPPPRTSSGSGTRSRTRPSRAAALRHDEPSRRVRAAATAPKGKAVVASESRHAASPIANTHPRGPPSSADCHGVLRPVAEPSRHARDALDGLHRGDAGSMRRVPCSGQR